MNSTEQTVLAISQTAKRWGTSPDTVRRAIEAGYLQSIYILGRRLIPIAEIERAEREGLGPGRKRWAKAARKEIHAT
jgi:hypothetical protein